MLKDLKYVKINNVNPLYSFAAKWMDTLQKIIKLSIQRPFLNNESEEKNIKILRTVEWKSEIWLGQ